MILQSVAKILQRESRTSDLACRYGGEEFVLLMPDTSAADAAKVCDRVRTAVEAARWPRLPSLNVTVSIGIAGASGSAPVSADQWVEATDHNLYTAKRAGRNRVVVTDLTAHPQRYIHTGRFGGGQGI
jgi:diguanylate cyclase (GGDEF)-like protein